MIRIRQDLYRPIITFSVVINVVHNSVSKRERDARFAYINASVGRALAAQQPLISVDTKKKDLVAEFKNAGLEWCPQGEPEEVRA